MNDVLSQLITFTSLLISLMYNLILPRRFKQQEDYKKQKDDYNNKYKIVPIFKEFMGLYYHINFGYIRNGGRINAGNISYINNLSNINPLRLRHVRTSSVMLMNEDEKRINAELDQVHSYRVSIYC